MGYRRINLRLIQVMFGGIIWIMFVGIVMVFENVYSQPNAHAIHI